MPQIDESFVDSQAPNADAIKNGRGLVIKGKFRTLHQSADGSLLFGECSGSGASPYTCSCDFLNPASPTHRCSCPSRQIPCKHCLGLMYAFVQRKKFAVAEVPDDIAAKREKAEQRAEKKKETAVKPKQVNKAALAKKIKAQLDGLELLETFTHELIRLGMGNLNAKTARQIASSTNEFPRRRLGNWPSQLPRRNLRRTDPLSRPCFRCPGRITSGCSRGNSGLNRMRIRLSAQSCVRTATKLSHTIRSMACPTR